MLKRTLEMKDKNIALLMCTYNGERFLKAQLDSIARQTYPLWKLFISDHGSQDKTLSILRRFQSDNPDKNIEIQSKANQGFAKNFMSLVCRSHINADYFAFSDHDDVWLPEKLETALTWLMTVSDETPALFCSRTELIDENDKKLGFSPLFRLKPSFKNALVQNVGGGNTMVFNNAARQLLITCGDEKEMVSHDWWLYMLVTACGGTVFYSSYPTVLYRQHDKNVIGSNMGFKPRLMRIKKLLKGDFKKWNDLHVRNLSDVYPHMTDANKKTFDAFRTSRNLGLFKRSIGILKSRLYRQTFLGNLGLIAATILKKL